MKKILTSFLIFLIPLLLSAQELPLWSEPEPVMYWNDGSLEHLGGDMPFISEDGQHLFVRWGNRGDTTYGHCSDIYVLHKQPDGTWSSPINLGRNINATLHEGATNGFTLSHDLKEIYWSFYSHWGWKCFRAFREDTSCDTCWTEPELFQPIPDLAHFAGNMFMSRNGLRLYFNELSGYYLDRECIDCEWDSVKLEGDCFPTALSNGAFTLSSSEDEFYMDGGSMLHGNVWYKNCVLDTFFVIYPLSSEADELLGCCLSEDGHDIYIMRRSFGLFVSHRLNVISESIPEKDDIFVSFTNNILRVNGNKNITKLTLYNILGRYLLSYKISSRYIEINLSNLPDGVYFAKIYSNNKRKVKKIIKIN